MNSLDIRYIKHARKLHPYSCEKFLIIDDSHALIINSDLQLNLENKGLSLEELKFFDAVVSADAAVYTQNKKIIKALKATFLDLLELAQAKT
jgi:hypothetical protein